MAVWGTDRLVLSPLEPEADGVPLHEAFTDPEVMRFWHRPPCAHPRGTIGHLAEALSRGDRKWALRRAGGDDLSA